MASPRILPLQWLLIAGDLLTLGVVTIAGFASHEILSGSGLRMLTTFLPLAAGWFMVAPFLGAYDLELSQNFTALWRPFWAMILAAPMAGWLRAVWLGTPVIPVFVAVLGGIAALSLLAWRLLFWVLWARRKPAHG